MKNYLAVLMPHGGAGGHIFLPDLLDCRAEAPNMEGAILLARDVSGERVRKLQLDGGAPASRT
jgi:hypothetical protein